MVDPNRAGFQSVPSEVLAEVEPRALAIAHAAVTDADFLTRVAEIAVELEARRARTAPVDRYMSGVEDLLAHYIAEFVNICRHLDQRLPRPNSLDAHLTAAELWASWVARGMWEGLQFIPELDPDGAVCVDGPGRHFPTLGSIKQKLVAVGISDDDRARSLSIIEPESLLKAARFDLRTVGADKRGEEAKELLGPDGCIPAAHNGIMALATLARACADEAVVVEGFSLNLVRGKLPMTRARQRQATSAKGAGSDRFSLEVVALTKDSSGTKRRLRVLDLALTPVADADEGPDRDLICIRVVEALGKIEAVIPEANRVLIIPYDLPLGPPDASRDVATSRISDDRLADHVRARSENRIGAAEFLVDLAARRHAWTLAAAYEPRGESIYQLQRRLLQQPDRSAFVIKTLQHHIQIEWLLVTPGRWEEAENQKRLRQLLTEWQGAKHPRGFDERRPAGHRVMFHGNTNGATADALTQMFLAYTLAEELELEPPAQ